MKENQNGFSIVEVLLVFVIAGLLGAAGWFVYQRQNNTDSSQAIPAVSDEWLDYKSSTHAVSFQYPSNWKVLTIDNSKGTGWDAVEGATYYYTIEEPETSKFMDIGVISKPFSEVVAWQESLFAGSNYYAIAEINNPSTKKSEFQFQGFPAVRFDTTGETVSHNKNNPAEPVNNTIIYINGGEQTYLVKSSGTSSLENTNPYNRIYESFKVLN